MASARAAARHHAPAVVALATLLLLLVAAADFVAAAGDGGEPGPPTDAPREDNRRTTLDCTMRCVTEAMGCATRCAGGARPDETPICAAACVQADIACLGGCGLPAPTPPGE